MDTPAPGQRPLRLADWLAHIESAPDRYLVAFAHGSLEVGVYAPRGEDTQSPHDRDELYVVAQGRGLFRRGEQVAPFGPGDALFVSAGATHRFERFSADFAAWVMFYGPEGGERDESPA